MEQEFKSEQGKREQKWEQARVRTGEGSKVIERQKNHGGRDDASSDDKRQSASSAASSMSLYSSYCSEHRVLLQFWDLEKRGGGLVVGCRCRGGRGEEEGV